MPIYRKALEDLLAASVIGLDDSVLVICGGPADRDTFLDLGFRNVVISNLDHHDGVTEFEPYSWDRQDAETIAYQDGTFDWVFVHAGLHHCGSPHKAVCEMLRVARVGIGAFEARDSMVLRLATRLGLVRDYELEPVALSGGKSGGLRNSPIPNYVYRWTEREVEKTVNSYMPQFSHRFRYFYGYLVPTQRLAMAPQLWKRFAARAFNFMVPVAEKLLPSQGNEFGFIVQKDLSLKPWLTDKSGSLAPNHEYLRNELKTEKYRKP